MPSKSTRKAQTDIASASALHTALIDAALKPNGAAAKTLVDRVGTAFAGLAARHGDAVVVARWRAEAEQLAGTVVQAPNRDVRLAAADHVAETYAALARSSGGGGGAFVQGSRAGPLTLAPPGGGNAGLAKLLGLWADGGRVIPPLVEIINLGGGAQPCAPGVLRSRARKPGLLAELTDAGLDPDFLNFLRLSDHASLRSYAAWRAQAPADGNAPDDYQIALARAHQAYEKDRFTDRYCRPGDIPAPGEQYGHTLLRLPLRLAQRDFRSAGCGPQIYEGELGVSDTPELDYEELVRRYVDLLKPRTRGSSDVNAVTRSDIVTAHLRGLGSADNPAVLSLMVVATQTALQMRSMATLIDLDDDLARGGRRLDDWLASPGGEEIRTTVLEAWRRLIAPPAATTPAAGSLPGGALSANAFRNAVLALCAPPPPPQPPFGNNVFEEPLVVSGGAALPGRFVAAVRPAEEIVAEVERLVGQFDAVWSQAARLLGPEGLRNATLIQLSGLEARAHIVWLTTASLHATPAWLQAPAGAPRIAVVQALETWLARVPVVIDYFDVVGLMPNLAQGVAQPYLAKTYWLSLPAAPPDFPQPRVTLHDEARAALGRVIGSYAAALDAVVSVSGAQGAAPAPGAVGLNGGISAADLPVLLARWTHLLVGLLDEQRAKRLAVNEPLLVLRLSPRRGRYGETPQRSALEALQREVKASAWPGHPTRETEGYVLEPMPSRYFMRYTPQIYLRQDFRLSLASRGYGIGANLYSMSLLPEEQQTIVVKSFKDTRSKVSESSAENVFEEAGSETSNDFANELARENQQESSNQTDVNVTGKASGGFLFGNFELSSGYSNKDSTRDFSKNVSNLTSKLAQKLSSKRTVAVETKRTGEVEEGTRNEVTTERTFKNPNMGHTVTFHWFQMTRKFLQELWLEDAKLVYSSGKHNVLRILTSGSLPPEVEQYAASRMGGLSDILTTLPPDIARRMPPGAAVVIVGEPYTETVSMSAANAFLARAFTTPRAVEINATLWRSLGYFDAAPDGLGVLAYPGNRRAEAGAADFVPLDNLPDPRAPGAAADPAHVVADTVSVTLDGAAVEAPFFLPNLDLRYRVRDGLPPARYTAARYDPYALPQLLHAEERVINTNGVFCEAMVGRCTALEDYLQRHRELDLLEKKINVGRQEIEFHWNLAKDHLVPIVEDADHALLALVQPAPNEIPFAERAALEQARLAEQQSMADAGLDRQKAELELAYRQAQIDELQQRIALMGTPTEVHIDAPDGASVAVNADVDFSGRDPASPHPGANLTVD